MKISAAVTGVLVAIGIALGFLVGRTMGEGSGNDATKGNGDGGRAGAGSGGGSSLGSGMRRSGAGGKADRNPAAIVRRIARELEFSPMAQMDFDIMFDTYESIRWMKPEEIREALAEVESMGMGNQGGMIISMMLLNLWAKQDGQGALEYSLASKNQMTKGMGVMSGLMGWVKNDPEGAWAWYETNKKSVKKSGMMGSQVGGMMFAALAQRDMDGAFSRLGELSKQEKQSALSMIAMQNYLDPVKRDDYIRNLEKLDDEELMQSSLQSMVGMWSYQDPQGAIEFIESRDWKDETRDQLETQVTSSWANLDAESALKWRMGNLEEGENRGDAVASTFATWMVQDSENARAWLQNQPAEMRTDQLYMQTAQQLQWNSNYEEAVGWAQQIGDDNSRVSTTRNIYNRWNSQDEEAAGEWINGVDAETREAIEKGTDLPTIQGTLDVVPPSDVAVPRAVDE